MWCELFKQKKGKDLRSQFSGKEEDKKNGKHDTV